MDFFELGNEYLINVPEIDNQHRELTIRLNDAIKHCTGKKNEEKKFYLKNMGKSINFMRDHFELEEKILCKTKYEKTEKHKLDHKRILDELIKMNDDIKKNKVELNLFYVTAFVRETVMKHIKKYDIPAKKHFKEGSGIK